MVVNFWVQIRDCDKRFSTIAWLWVRVFSWLTLGLWCRAFCKITPGIKVVLLWQPNIMIVNHEICPLCPTWKANRHQSTHNRWYCWIAKHVFQFVAAILVLPLLFSRSFTLLLASTVCIMLRWRNEVPLSHYFKTLFPLRRICADFLPLLGTIFKIKVHQETEACSWD